MGNFIVNCRRLPLDSTLGVGHFVLQLARALAQTHSVTFAVTDVQQLDRSPAGDFVRSFADTVVSLDEATSQANRWNDSIELVPHHFQTPELGSWSMLACHDLHVFDIPWKYGDRAVSMQAAFRRNLTAASAVLCHFPRTYFRVEEIAEIRLPKLFLTESPLLVDTADVFDRAGNDSADDAVPYLLYPAQLQEHKNHESLIKAVAVLVASGESVRVLCPGSDFSEEITDRLRMMVASEGVADNVTFLGRVSDAELVELYRGARGVVIPSLAEGGAYVAMEAVAAGKPVAVNRIESAEMHLNSVGAQVHWFDATDVDSTIAALKFLNGVDANTWRDQNSIARDRIVRTGWDVVAARWSAVADMLQGGDRPLLAIDADLGGIEYVPSPS